MKIVGAMNVKNEEYIIEYSLTALSEIVDEIVVVDDGSTDRTVDIINKFKKVTNLFCKKPGKKRTEIRDWNMLTRFAGEREANWILYIDADEILEPKAKYEIRKLVEDRSVGEYWFRKITLWKGFDYYRVDNPEEFIFYGQRRGMNPILVRYSPHLKWYDIPLWKKIARFLIRGEKFYPMVPQYGRYFFDGAEGKKVYVDDIVALHLCAVDFSRFMRDKFKYFYWQTKTKPRTSCDDMIKWIMRKVDESTLKLAAVKKEWLWGFEHLIKLPQPQILESVHISQKNQV